MKEIILKTTVHQCQPEDLSEEELALLKAAKQATYSSYAPYSGFSVGAAALLEGGEIVCGSNQENAAYPSGLCAERVALFYASSQYAGQPVRTLAVAARNQNGFTTMPTAPCGACRQVFAELKTRFHTPLRLLLYGTSMIYRIEDACELLPLSFQNESML